MYNGIGLQTARGSGTNGYVQRNMSFIHKSKEKVNYKTEEDIQKLESLANRKPNPGILAHERKRIIELKCVEMQELMEDQGYPEDEIESKVALFRQMLVEKEGVAEKEIPKDDFGRPLVKETHQIAEANQEKNSKMREALGISQYFVEGSSLDPARKAKEAAKEAAAEAAKEAKKKYTLIPDSDSGSSPEQSQDKEKDKKRKKKKSHSSREKVVDVSPKKKKSSKKHKKDRSISPDVQKKKKPQKSVKEKPKHKSKSDASHKKSHSSSSSSNSSESADDESSSRSSSSESQSDASPEKPKSSSKQEKEKSGKQPRRRSTSSERIRYSKDARSRKDIYEAKKAKHKRKSARTSSSSSGASSPKQYYRLEPVLLKSKSKHKKSRQIIEIPKKSTFELMKYDKKKRARFSSHDSSVEEISKPESKRRKRSETPPVASKSRYEREDAKPLVSAEDPYKTSRHSAKDSRTHQPSKHRNRSRSFESPYKSHHKQKAVSDDESDYSHRKRKEQYKEKVEPREGKSSRKHGRRAEESPVNQNGHSKHHAKSRDPEPSDSEESLRSASVPRHKRHIPKSPSRSPPVYKNKKHVIHSPPYQPSNAHKKKVAPRSPSHSPPKTSSRNNKSRKEPSKSPPPQKHSRRHDSDSSSHSPVIVESRRSKKEAVKKSSKKRDKSISTSRSPSVHRESKNKAKSRTNRSNQPPSDSNESDGSSDHYVSKKRSSKGWKSKGEVKEVVDRSCSSSPVQYKSKQKDKTTSDTSRRSPKSKKGMTVIVESFQITPPPKEASQEPPIWTRDSISASPNRIETKKHKKDKTLPSKDTENKVSPVWVKPQLRNSIPKSDCQNSDKTELNPNPELKIKRGSIDVGSEAAPEARNTIPNEAAFVAPKNSWNLVSNAIATNDDSCSQNLSIVSVPVTKASTTNATTSENPRLKSKNKARPAEVSRSRSRSGSRSGSERSSRSRSYDRREKSYSRSPSYSKSRSRSHSQRRTKSRSPSHGRSRSKSYSRSRSISIDSSRSRSRSYSSRSRSRSGARSPSIPRRRGSPSFLDKRRITSARKRPVPYRRPSPSSPSSGSSWSYRSSSPTHPLFRENSMSPRSQSWSPVIRNKFQIALNAALR